MSVLFVAEVSITVRYCVPTALDALLLDLIPSQIDDSAIMDCIAVYAQDGNLRLMLHDDACASPH